MADTLSGSNPPKQGTVTYCIHTPYASGYGSNSYVRVYIIGYTGECKPTNIRNKRVVYKQCIGVFDSRYTVRSAYSDAIQYAQRLCDMKNGRV